MTSTTARAPIDPVLAEAASWTAQLRSGAARPEEFAAFDAWRAGDPRREAAAQRISRALVPLDRLRADGVPGALLREAMTRADRRAAMRAITLGLGGPALGVVGWRMVDANGMLADQHTGIAQRRQEPLPDGSSLWLDARTAVDVAFDDGQRTLLLRRGQLLAQAAPRTRDPFLVRAPLATLQADGGRFVVQASGEHTRLTALAGTAEVVSPAGERWRLDSGRSALFTKDAAPRFAASRGTEDLWTKGLVALNDQPLGELVEALQPYRSGLLRVEPAAAQIRISGVFSLDDTDRTLAALERTQPVRVRRRTDFWVVIGTA
jgi:transmembrane sensor